MYNKICHAASSFSQQMFEGEMADFTGRGLACDSVCSQYLIMQALRLSILVKQKTEEEQHRAMKGGD